MSSFTNTAKNTATLRNLLKGGSAQKYDDANLTYDELFDPTTGLPIYYDAAGTTPVFTNQAKNSITPSNQTKS